MSDCIDDKRKATVRQYGSYYLWTSSFPKSEGTVRILYEKRSYDCYGREYCCSRSILMITSSEIGEIAVGSTSGFVSRTYFNATSIESISLFNAIKISTKQR